MPAVAIKFHTFHGKNVVLSADGCTATRTGSFFGAIAFSNRPIAIEETVCLKLAEVRADWNGVLRLGIVGKDPVSFAQEIPKYLCPDMVKGGLCWAKAMPERHCVQDTLLTLTVYRTGELYIGINGARPALFLNGINICLPMYIVVDIYGNTTAVQFMNNINAGASRRESRQLILANAQRTTTGQSTPLPPTPAPEPAVVSLASSVAPLHNLMTTTSTTAATISVSPAQPSPVPFLRPLMPVLPPPASVNIPASWTPSGPATAPVSTNISSPTSDWARLLSSRFGEASSTPVHNASGNQSQHRNWENLFRTNPAPAADLGHNRPPSALLFDPSLASQASVSVSSNSATMASTVEPTPTSTSSSIPREIIQSVPEQRVRDLQARVNTSRQQHDLLISNSRSTSARGVAQYDRSRPTGLTVVLPPPGQGVFTTGSVAEDIPVAADWDQDHSSASAAAGPTSSEIPDVVKMIQESECIVCMHRNVDTALYPCGHANMCFKCAPKFTVERGRGCPVCQKPVIDVLRLYMG